MATEESCEDRLRELYPGLVGTTLIRLRSRDKRPLDSEWNTRATENYVNKIDPSEIVAAVARHLDEGGNVGWAIPPGVLVLDADNATSAEWVTRAFPDAPRQRTAKGCHVVVQAPKEVDLKQTTQLEIADGITVDLRTSGRGQIAVEPSIHPSGVPYYWEIELPLDLDRLPEIPAAMVEQLKVQRSAETVDISEAIWREGSRESRLISMAGRLRNMSLSETEIHATLDALNRARCDPPLEARDITRLARSASKWDQGADPTEEETSHALVFFTGDRLRELTRREPLAPLYPGIPAVGHLNLLIGPSFAGKTTLALWIAMARAAGVAPWTGAPRIPTGRTLFVSPDEPVEQVARQILRLAYRHPGGRTCDYFASISVLGLDVSVPPETLDGLRFDEAGFRLLDQIVAGYAAVVIDAYADMLPLEASEDSNEDASRIGGALQALAVKHGVPITLVHHIGKARGGTEDIDPRDLGRGASALAAKARAIGTFEEVAGFPQQRRIRSRTNLTRSPGPLEIEVTESHGEDTSIDFLRPVDAVAAFPVDMILSDGDGWISTSDLARRLVCGDDESGGRPPGNATRIARELRSTWLAAGLIEIRKGKHNSTELRRI